jgi:hypothetical protein
LWGWGLGLVLLSLALAGYEILFGYSIYNRFDDRVYSFIRYFLLFLLS